MVCLVLWALCLRGGKWKIGSENVTINGQMDSARYISILQKGYLGTLEDLHTNQHNFTLQADSNPKYTSKAAQGWLKENHISTLNWPASSPDMNIMENLWVYLDNCIWAYPRKLVNSTELWEVLQGEWKEISPGYIRKLHESLPRCIEEVCNAKGGNTKY
jgi:hypothetical protein